MASPPDDAQPSSIEKMIMKSTGETDLKRIRKLLKLHDGDANKVIGEIYENTEHGGDHLDDQESKVCFELFVLYDFGCSQYS